MTPLKHINRGITRCIETIAPEIDEDAVNILISHLTVQGGKTSDSEKTINYWNG